MFEKSLHGLRGAAAFGVFAAHSAGGYSEHLCNSCSFSSALNVINNIGTLGVEIFFFLSGYVMYLASLHAQPLAFIKRRFWRLYPILLLFTLLFFVGNHFLDIEPQKNDWRFLFYNLIFINLFTGTPALTPNAWTITYEVIFYLFTFTGVYFGIRYKNWLLFVPIIVTGLVFFYYHPISAYYFSGLALSVLNHRFTHWRSLTTSRWLKILEILSLLTILVVGSQEQDYRWEWIIGNPQSVLLLVAVFVFVGCLLHPASLFRNWLTGNFILFLGTISYSLYLAHPYTYFMTKKIVQTGYFSVDMSGVTHFVIFAMLALVSTIAFSWIVHCLLEAPVYRKMTGKNIIGR